jgi:hypothetical protein
MPSVGRRVLRMRSGTAVVLALPALLLVFWYTWQAVLRHSRAVAGTGVEEPLTAEVFQLHLHDLLRRDARRLVQGGQGPRGKLPTFALYLSNRALDRLDATPPTDGDSQYEDGELTFRGRKYDVRARYRGSKHWHWRYPQKSWKLRLESPTHLLGHETLLLLNSPEPEPLVELALLEIAKEQELLVPSFAPARLLLNENPMGLYFLEAPADEGTLRAARRFPWNLYSGNGAPPAPDTGVSRLFSDVSAWTKAAYPPGQERDLSELAALLQALGAERFSEFRRFAEQHLNLDAFARFDAVDIVFGIDQHNYGENQKLYFDPYRGRFEPVEWNLRGADHSGVLQRAASPLSLRLAELPAYAQRRNRLVWKLLEDDARPERLAQRLERWDERLGDAFEEDNLWDAVGLLPELNAYYAELVRPMDRSRQLAARRKFLHRMTERNAFLREELGRPQWELRLEVAPAVATPTRPAPAMGSSDATVGVPPPAGTVTRLTFGARGHAGFELEELSPEFEGNCAEAGWSWRRRLPLPFEAEAWSNVYTPSARVQALLPPGSWRAPRPVHPLRGRVRHEPELRHYVFELRSPCPPVAVRARGRNAVTHASAELRAALSETPMQLPELVCSDRFEPNEGGRSQHPWCSEGASRVGESRDREAVITLGPGVVAVTQTRVYDARTSVTIVPGTTFEMANGASMVFQGPLRAEGSPTSPIRWQGHAWGTLALTGPATRGSTLAHAEVRGAQKAVLGLTHFPAALSIHDTERVAIKHVSVFPARGGEDAVHLVYVKRAELDHVRIQGAPQDGVDLEYSSAKARDLDVVDSGDDAIDLMGTQLELVGAALLHCGGNGVSAGEETEVALTEVIVSACARGLLAKNASRLRAERVALSDLQNGVRVEQHSDWYEGESALRGRELFARATPLPLDLAGRPQVDAEVEALSGRDSFTRATGSRRLASEADFLAYAARRAAELRTLRRPR